MKKNVIASLAGCLLLVIMMFMTGCNRSASMGSTTKFFLGLDATGSNQSRKNVYAGAAHAVLTEMPYTSFEVTMVAFGSPQPPSKIFTGKVDDPDQLAKSFQDYWTGAPPKGKGTFWKPVLGQVTKVTEPTAVMIFSDGEIYDIEACESLVKEIAANTNIKAIFIGPVLVESQYGDQWRAKIEKLFSPLGTRAFVAGSNDQGQQLQAFAEAIQK